MPRIKVPFRDTKGASHDGHGDASKSQDPSMRQRSTYKHT